ncbi:VOC family protein [Mucilaginibacter sp. BJC16-A38]|uniref:VOC family protein n=1 Tax=Mucilaginibacter phenanthrenivorans TaxID=1234842 RepID=UPI0021580732|nr:VOC family protein [Mucilaginibacter phenanthrenivorans]MCR8557609.1 VOC family protein [Mucilaginibacter phenanthrenivorans]
MNFKFNHIQHIGIPVTDLNISEKFYQKLGFENVMASGFDHNGERGKMAMMQKGDMIIEIYQFPDAELDKIRNRADGHVDHVAFDVDDIDLAFSELKNASFRIIEEAPVFLPFWKNGCKYFNILGPNNERLEFNQIL